MHKRPRLKAQAPGTAVPSASLPCRFPFPAPPNPVPIASLKRAVRAARTVQSACGHPPRQRDYSGKHSAGIVILLPGRRLPASTPFARRIRQTVSRTSWDGFPWSRAIVHKLSPYSTFTTRPGRGTSGTAPRPPASAGNAPSAPTTPLSTIHRHHRGRLSIMASMQTPV